MARQALDRPQQPGNVRLLCRCHRELVSFEEVDVVGWLGYSLAQAQR